LRGHGETRIRHDASCSMEVCTRDLVALWDELGVERSHVVGYSMGGRLALHVAAKRPDRLLSLVTIGAHAGLDEGAREGRRRGDDALANRIEKEGIEAFVKYWGSLPLFAGLERRGPSVGFELDLRVKPRGVARRAQPLLVEHPAVVDSGQRELVMPGPHELLDLARHVDRTAGGDPHSSIPSVNRSA